MHVWNAASCVVKMFTVWTIECYPQLSVEEIWFFDVKSQNFLRLAAAKFRFRPSCNSGLYVCFTVRNTGHIHTYTYDVNFMCKMYGQTGATVQRGKNAEIGASTHFWNISTLSSILGETLNLTLYYIKHTIYRLYIYIIITCTIDICTPYTFYY